ncbi:MAG: ATP-binding protein [Chloroflexi bacterium]|nr:ATP-binding protein [Chloroflexota bacterium]MBP8057088.1 ATP-binding protein [Chloroflexota bacterium]
MLKEFVGRNMELGLLDNLYRRRGAQLLILYGRRRIGKTRLIGQWGTGVGEDYFYWMASQTSATNQLRNFSQAWFKFLNPQANIDATFSYASWDAAFAEIARVTATRRLVVVLDEFTYVMQADTEVPSLLQKAWDHHLNSSQVFLILLGSLAGIIQRTALDYQSPLYGRATARLKLHSLSFGALAGLLPNYDPEQHVAVHTMTGGVPAYVELFDDQLTILQNLQQNIVIPTNVMLTDAVFLLREQLDEPNNYIAILETIAAGFHQLTDIATMAGIDRSNITKYLSVLRELGYVERVVPATIHRPEQSRQGRYVITDAYLRFYYRFLAPHLTAIEQGRVRQATSLLYDHLLDFIGTHTFEELCRDWVGIVAEMGEFPFLPERIGSFWSQKAQVDVLAINWRTKDILLGECKWGKTLVDKDVIEALVKKTPKVLPEEYTWQVHYAFFARQGFTERAKAVAATHRALLITLPQLEADMQRWLQVQQWG